MITAASPPAPRAAERGLMGGDARVLRLISAEAAYPIEQGPTSWPWALFAKLHSPALAARPRVWVFATGFLRAYDLPLAKRHLGDGQSQTTTTTPLGTSTLHLGRARCSLRALG